MCGEERRLDRVAHVRKVLGQDVHIMVDVKMCRTISLA